MTIRKLILLFFICFVGFASAKAQLIGFRFGVNSGMFVNELGTSDIPHPDIVESSPALSSKSFKAQPTIGAEAEVLFQVSPMSHLGIELEYAQLKGYNNTPPLYNYYLTSYYFKFQPGGEFVTDPVAFNTTLFNLAANWRYFFFEQSPIQPFVKLTGVVTFLGTSYTFKENSDAEYFNSEILYARGTSNSDQKMLPAFHLGGGVGFEYLLGNRWSLQADLTATAINSDIVNGVPNFTYIQGDGQGELEHNKQFSLITQVSIGVVYSIEVSGSGKAGSGKTDSNFPFYRRR